METYKMTIWANFDINTNVYAEDFDIIEEINFKSLDNAKFGAWTYFERFIKHLEIMNYGFNPSEVFHTTQQDGNKYYEEFEYDDDRTRFAIVIQG